jgi:hypothetical protein
MQKMMLQVEGIPEIEADFVGLAEHPSKSARKGFMLWQEAYQEETDAVWSYHIHQDPSPSWESRVSDCGKWVLHTYRFEFEMCKSDMSVACSRVGVVSWLRYCSEPSVGHLPSA